MKLPGGLDLHIHDVSVSLHHAVTQLQRGGKPDLHFPLQPRGLVMAALTDLSALIQG
jgi:hypothetical protein